MNQPILFKRIAAGLFSKLPVWPPSFIMAQALGQALRPLIEDGSLLPLNDKRVVIIVEDLGVQFKFTLRGTRFTPIPESSQADLSIRATLSDFYLLATRQEDPDTLFFNRRLIIEGDTELGLIAKNTMDSMEVPKPLLALSNALKALDALRNRSQSRQQPL